MKKITNEEKLKVILTAAIKGGWKPDMNRKHYKTTGVEKFTVEHNDLPYWQSNGVIIRFWLITEWYNSKSKGGSKGFVTFPDLLSDSSAMEAIFGDKNKCFYLLNDITDEMYEKNITCFVAHQEGYQCKLCEFCMPAHEYYSVKAHSIIYGGGDGVGYLYEQLTKLAENAEGE